MAFPTLTIRFSPTSAWNAAAPVWSNVQAVTYDVGIKRGRQFELDKIEAATASLRLNNRAGDFWPDNAAGTYYPNVLPGKRINIRATFSAVTYDLYTGFIESWFPLPLGMGGTPEAQITTADLLKNMAIRKISNAGYAQALSGTRIGLILDDFGWKDRYEQEILNLSPVGYWRLNEASGAALDSSGNGNNGTVGVNVTPGAAGLLGSAYTDTSHQFPGTNPGILGADSIALPQVAVLRSLFAAGGTFSAWGVLDSQANTSIFHTVTEWEIGVSTASATTAKLRFLHQFSTTHGIWDTASFVITYGAKFHVVVTYNSSSVLNDPIVYIDGVSVSINEVQTPVGTASVLSSNLYIGGIATAHWPGRIQEVALFKTVLTASQILTLYGAGQYMYRDIDAGKSQVQASGVLTDSLVRTLLDDVLTAEQGYVFMRGDGAVVFHDRHARISSPQDTSQVTLGDDAGERAYFEPQFEITDAQVINHVSVTRSGGSSQVANDTTSQAAYGPRSEVRSGVILTTDAEALSQAQYRLNRFKGAILRLKSITLLPAADAANLFPQALGREIGDRITVRLDDASVDGDYHIEGIEHSIASQGRWRTVWQVSPADPQTYWKLGVAGFTELGSTTRLAW